MKLTTMLFATALAACGAVTPSTTDDAGSDAGSGSANHPPGQLYGSVRDERGDTIDFSTGEPVHTHAGALIDLSSGCPDVYYYAYLLDSGPPAFGRETTLNPLALHIATDDGVAYRVLAGSEVVRDWTPAPSDAGVTTIELHRDAIPSLGTTGGAFYVDVRLRDAAGNDTITRACWMHHPLAAPIAIAPLAPAELFGMSLPAHSPISRLINDRGTGTGVDVASASIVQYTAEPIALGLDLAQPSGRVATTYADTWVAYGSVLSGQPCSYAGVCDVGVPATQTSALAGDLAAAQWLVRVVDDASGEMVCSSASGPAFAATSSCMLPPRASGTAPRSYHAIVSSSGIAALRAPISASAIYGEYTLGDTHLTGSTEPMTKTSCNQIVSKTLGGPTSCVSQTVYQYVHALDTAAISFDPISLSITAAPAAHAPFESLRALAMVAHSWDAGSGGF